MRLLYLVIIIVGLMLNACAQTEPDSQNQNLDKIYKSTQEWKEILTEEQYYITREKGTERAYTGEHWNNIETGVYVCVACKLPLFSSSTKFKSGTGWPSYYEPIVDNHVMKNIEKSYGMVRTEVLCYRCESHLGHVFNDGPNPTGLRYCINSLALNFIPNQ